MVWIGLCKSDCSALHCGLFVGHGLVAHYKILVVHDDDQILDEIALLDDVAKSALFSISQFLGVAFPILTIRPAVTTMVKIITFGCAIFVINIVREASNVRVEYIPELSGKWDT